MLGSNVGWHMKAGLVVLGLMLSGCAVGGVALPSRPALPTVRYVAPCDPQAVAGLTQDAVEALRNRDLLWQQHVERLERQMEGPR